ncbi:MAG: DUF4148 domain-containing protein [Candidatus Eremiobacteraeota bacterium]|nr:DUF4148 domain-containing protein [Candidatus Eremiobacteraeota bacterium]
MRRLFIGALALASLASTLVFAAPASAAHDSMSSHPRCPRGSHWVPPHRDKHGKWVPGHCRKT